MKKIPTLNDTFSPLAAQARGDEELKPYGSLPPSKYEIKTGEAPVPLVQRRAEYLEEKLKHTAQEGKGMPRKCLLSTFRGHTNVVTCCKAVLLGSQEFLFTGSLDSTVRAFHVVTGKCIQIYEGHSAGISSLDVHSIGGTSSQKFESRVIDNACDPVWEDHDLDIFDFKEKVSSFDRSEKIITARVFSKGEYDVLIGSVEILLKRDILKGEEDKDVRVNQWYDLKAQNIKKSMGQLQLEFEWTQDDGKLRIFVREGKKFPKMKNAGKEGGSSYVTINIEDQPIMRLFTVSDDTTARMWDINTGKVLKAYVGHTQPITSVLVETVHGSQFVFTGSLDKTVMMWNAQSGKWLGTFRHASAVNCLCVQVLYDDMRRDVSDDMIHSSPPEIRLHIEYILDVVARKKLVRVTVEQARNLPVMDHANLCNPYVQVSLGDAEETTKVLSRPLQR